MPIIVVEPLRWSRSPIQTFFLCLIALTGLLTILGLSNSPVTKDMGRPWSIMWGSALILGTATALIGSFYPNKLTGMFIERSGVFLLGGASALWPLVIVLKLGIFSSPFTIASTGAFAATCFLQVRYINKHINIIIKTIAERRPTDE